MFPGVGDTVRAPQWLWVSLGALPLALTHLFSYDRGSFRRLKASVPHALWPWLGYVAWRWYRGGFLGTRALVFPALLFAGALVVAASPRRAAREKLLRVLAVVTALQLAIGLAQALGHDPLFTHVYVKGLDPYLPAGFTGQHTMFGLLMAWLAFTWFFEGRWIGGALCTVAVFATGSAFSLASWSVGALWLLFCAGYRKLSAALVALLLGGGWFFFLRNLDSGGSFFYANGRFEVLVLALKAWRQNPWLGFGVGGFSRNFARYFQGYGGVRWLEAHNEWLEYLFNLGLVGYAFLAPLLAALARRAWRVPPSREKNFALGTLAVIGVNTLGNFSLQIAPFAALTAFSLAWLCCRGS